MSMRARYVSGDEAKLNRMAFGKKISRLVSGCAIARDQMRVARMQIIASTNTLARSVFRYLIR
jgi:hypothetical protein